MPELSAPTQALGALPTATAEDLNAAYNQYIYAPNREQLMARWALAGDEVVRRLGKPALVTYGAGATENIQLFRAPQDRAPVHIHFRGGGWRHLPPLREHGFIAEMFVRAGATIAYPDFDGIDKNGGNFMPIADQVRRAVAWIYRNAESFGGDPGRIFVSGHSTGAHLASVVATTDWRAAFDLPADIVKGVLCSSGVYDLYPAGVSGRFPAGRFDAETIAALSSIRHIERLTAPIVVSYAKLETPGFCRQARDFAAALKTAGKAHTFVAADQYNHLEIFETLASPYGVLGRLALEQMGLARP